MDEINKKLLTRTEDRISFLYIEKSKIYQSEYGVEIIRGNEHIEIPITTINVIIIGPGVSITHKAVCNIAAAGCTICFTGEEINCFYSYGEPTTHSSKNLLKQVYCHENKQEHLKVVHRMYEIRYPNDHLKSKTIDELRGIEGQKVKSAYEKAAKINNLQWNGRAYNVDDFCSQDIPNQYLTAINHTLYAIVTAMVVSLGFSPAIGFIHTGHMNSFIFDIADLYKEKYIIPLAFSLSINGYYDRHMMLSAFQSMIVEEKLMKKMVNDLLSLFVVEKSVSPEIELQLWGDKHFGIFGKNYASKP